MIDIATEEYGNGQLFEHPWQFWVIDNFLDHNIYNELLQIKDTGYYELVDHSNGFRTSIKNYVASKHHVRLRSKKYPELYTTLSENCESMIKKYLALSNQINWTNKNHFVFDLVRCEPKYAYQKHRDHEAKIVSIVVYIHPSEANGTILFDANDNEYNVVWKPNRALIFTSGCGGMHKYINTTESNRFSLNIYMVDGPWEFEVTVPENYK